MLELSSVSRAFSGLRIIDDLELRVERGELVGILGPNGAGKTTLFNLITGNLQPSAGRVVFKGRDLVRMAVWDRCRLGIARTFQVPKPFTHMSVFENVLVAAVHGGRLSLGEARHRAMEVLDETGFGSRAATSAGRLTLLDLKRLELAKALVQKPELLLLDEIAGGLTDPECDQLLAIISAIHARGATIVWIEHVLHALMRAASRLAVLYGGKILTTGSPRDVLADPRVQEVYLGS
jgi:branched-chain amino acid transport system ATP-binding protein